jgi:hypothetical protein
MPQPSGPTALRRTTLADVAAHAGVSVALVSIVIRDAPGASPAGQPGAAPAAQP